MMEKKMRQDGFTLIQVILSIAIFVMLLLAMNTIFSRLYRQQRVSVGMIERTNAANRVLAQIGDELRQANRSKNGDFLLVTAGTDTLTFYSDIDGDSEMEKVTYARAGAELRKTVIEPGVAPYYLGTGVTKVVCQELDNGTTPVFTYYDDSYIDSGTSMAAPIVFADVRLVGIHLELNRPATTSSYKLKADTKVRLRNVSQ